MAPTPLPSRNTLPQRLVGVSTKMYFTLSQTASYATQLQGPDHQSLLKGNPSSGVFFIPPFPALMLPEVQKLRQSGVILGAQNCHWEDSGAFTGEVSPAMCKEVGCSIVELGHAERRRAPFNETDEIVAIKAFAVIRNKMVPLICIGEKDKGESISQGVGMAISQCQPQIYAVLNTIPDDADVIFAYEPIWAIGASEPASADYVNAVVGFLRELKEVTGRSGQVRFLYGGSAGPGTWEQLKGSLDGLFLGRFAHNVDAFVESIREVTA